MPFPLEVMEAMWLGRHRSRTPILKDNIKTDKAESVMCLHHDMLCISSLPQKEGESWTWMEALKPASRLVGSSGNLCM
jgi:hypothetical protein